MINHYLVCGNYDRETEARFRSGSFRLNVLAESLEKSIDKAKLYLSEKHGNCHVHVVSVSHQGAIDIL